MQIAEYQWSDWLNKFQCVLRILEIEISSTKNFQPNDQKNTETVDT